MKTMTARPLRPVKERVPAVGPITVEDSDPMAVVRFRSTSPVARRAFLLAVEGPDVGRRFELVRGRTLVGRDACCDVVLHAPNVSREHCAVDHADGICRVTDLGSRNGTFVDGAPVSQTLLTHGSELQVGSTSMLLDYDLRDEGSPVTASDEFPAVHPAIRSQLTPREAEVVGCVVAGLTNAHIAEILGCSPFTVRNHLAAVFRKLDAGSRAELVRIVVRGEAVHATGIAGATSRVHGLSR